MCVVKKVIRSKVAMKLQLSEMRYAVVLWRDLLSSTKKEYKQRRVYSVKSVVSDVYTRKGVHTIMSVHDYDCARL